VWRGYVGRNQMFELIPTGRPVPNLAPRKFASIVRSLPKYKDGFYACDVGSRVLPPGTGDGEIHEWRV